MNVKASISIDEEILGELEKLAKDWQVSRSDIFSKAVKEFIEKQKNRTILAELNQAYGKSSSDDEKKFQKAAKKYSSKVIDQW